jgi:putative glutamine amidotransferase
VKKPLIGCSTYHNEAKGKTKITMYGLMPAYTHAISKAGGIPVMIPLGLSEDDLAETLSHLDGLLLPGGGDVDPNNYEQEQIVEMWGIDPERDRVEIALAREAMQMDLPLLGICRGVQILNVAMGGSLWGDIRSQYPSDIAHDNYNGDHPRNYIAHKVCVEPHSKLHAILGIDAQVNSLHHQGVKQVGAGLQVVATAPDGFIEGLEAPDRRFAVGVQWHPENLVGDDPEMLGLFEAFVNAAAGR